MKVAAKIDMKSRLTKLYEIANDTGECISALQTAFIYNTPKPLEEYRTKAEAVQKETGPCPLLLRKQPRMKRA